MWYSFRGKRYLPSVATSIDGITWKRKDKIVGIGPSTNGWDSEMLCYPFVADQGEKLFMFYNGNGASGLGVAVVDKKNIFESLI